MNLPPLPIIPTAPVLPPLPVVVSRETKAPAVTDWINPHYPPVRTGEYDVQIKFGEIYRLLFDKKKRLWYYPGAEMCCDAESLHVIAFGWRGLAAPYQGE